VSIATTTELGACAGEIAASPGDDYRFVLDGGDAWPDPCSRWLDFARETVELDA